MNKRLVKFLIKPYLNHDEKVGGPAWAEKGVDRKEDRTKLLFRTEQSIFKALVPV